MTPSATRSSGAARRVGLVAVGLAVLLAACGSSPARSTTAPTSPAVPAPAGLPAFYAVPAGVAAKAPGTLLKSEEVPTPGLHGRAYRVMYVSTDEGGHPAAVTGVVFVPREPAPAGGYPVVTWAHGTNGMADSCAPSLKVANVLGLDGTNRALDLGWEVVASDYQGEGTPPHLLPYLVGELAARDTIDIVLAAHQLAGAHPSARYVVWGHSEGGQTAMFAWHLATTYGSRSGLRPVGVVAGAPPSQLGFIYQALTNSPFRFYLLMAAAGFNQAYGNQKAPLDQVLTPLGESLLPLLHTGCFGPIAAAVDRYPMAQIVKADPFQVPAWHTLIAANDPANIDTTSPVPLLIIQGGADEQIPVASTQLLAQHLCSLGQVLQRWIYPGQSHAGVITASAPDMTRWISDRFAGGPNPDPYVPHAQAGIQTTTCDGHGAPAG